METMSANRDKSQKFSFVYTNFYDAYKKAKGSELPNECTSQVIKAKDLNASPSSPRVQRYEPIRFLKNHSKNAPDAAVEGLKKNLSELERLHSRLQFMLLELEELVKE